MAHACGCRSEQSSRPAGTAELSLESTVGGLVVDFPAARAVLRSHGIDLCCGAGLTLRQAASAGADPAKLLAALGAVTGGPPVAVTPAAAAAPSGREVHLDVRADILAGREPLGRILASVDALAPADVLVLRTPFEPVPLYRKLGALGFEHRTEQRAVDDWSVRFERRAGTCRRS